MRTQARSLHSMKSNIICLYGRYPQRLVTDWLRASRILRFETGFLLAHTAGILVVVPITFAALSFSECIQHGVGSLASLTSFRRSCASPFIAEPFLLSVSLSVLVRTWRFATSIPLHFVHRILWTQHRTFSFKSSLMTTNLRSYVPQVIAAYTTTVRLTGVRLPLSKTLFLCFDLWISDLGSKV